MAGGQRANRLRETLAALSDPTRVRIVEALTAGPRTASALARILGVEPNPLYYHLRTLKSAGVIEVVDRVHEGRLPEQRFGIAAGQGLWDDKLPLSGDCDARATFFASLLRATAAELEAAVHGSGHRDFMLTRSVLHAPSAAVHRMHDQMVALATEVAQESTVADARSYRFTVAIYELPDSTEEDT